MVFTDSRVGKSEFFQYIIAITEKFINCFCFSFDCCIIIKNNDATFYYFVK